jgi:hypothetical protein
MAVTHVLSPSRLVELCFSFASDKDLLTTAYLFQRQRAFFDVIRLCVCVTRLNGASDCECLRCRLAIYTSRQPRCEAKTRSIGMTACLDRLALPSCANNDKMEADGRCMYELADGCSEQKIYG